jgi:hypothetical protein
VAAPVGEGYNPAEQALLAALSAFLGSPLASQATYLPQRLSDRFSPLGFAGRAVREAGRLALSVPLTGRGPNGSPVTPLTSTVRQVKVDEPMMRAQYVLAAAKRLTVAAGADVWAPAARLEGNFLKMHRAAGINRLRAAGALDRVAIADGPWLIWQTQHDSLVEADCARLDGSMFTVDNLPDGQIPGAVHPCCRCYATGMAGAVLDISPLGGMHVVRAG